MAGYSGTPLAKKLGMKPGFRVRLQGAPKGYEQMVEPLPEDVQLSTRFRQDVDIWHMFVRKEQQFRNDLATARQAICEDGAIWISWPKKSSGIDTEVDGDLIRQIAPEFDLVDIKVCAVDDTWSGLKLVIRKEMRRS